MPEGTETVDASGLLVLPGGVDGLSHLAGPRSPGAPADDLGSGTIAAAAGGVTTVVAAAPAFAGEDPAATFADARVRAEGHVLVDWLALAGVSEPDEALERSLGELRAAPGFAGVLIELDGPDRHAPDRLAATLRACGATGTAAVIRLAGRHGELEHARVRHLAGLCALADVRALVAPLTRAASLRELDDDVLDGAASLAHLCLDALPEGTALAPPPGDEVDRDALWAALADGRLGEVVSDHRPPGSGSREPGLSSLELRLAALHSEGVAAGRIGLERLAAITAEAPARRLGVYPRKGSLSAGADADVVLLDPEERWRVEPDQLQSRGRAPAWHGRELTGRARAAMSRGTWVLRDGEVLLHAGRGGAARRLSVR